MPISSDINSDWRIVIWGRTKSNTNSSKEREERDSVTNLTT